NATTRRRNASLRAAGGQQEGHLRAPDVPIRARYLRGSSAGRLSSRAAAGRAIRMAHYIRSGPETALPLQQSDNCRGTPVLERSIDPTAVSAVGSLSSGERRADADPSSSPL